MKKTRATTALLILLYLGFGNCYVIVDDALVKESIHGGFYEKTNNVPYAAYLLTRNESRNKSGYCSATIISRSWLLTSAHCTSPGYNFTIGVGDILSKSYFHEVEKVIIHEKFDLSHFHNDVALLKLKNPLTFDALQRPIPIVNRVRADLFKGGKKFKVTGFGVEIRGKLRFDMKFPKSTFQISTTESICRERYSNVRKAPEKAFFCGQFEAGGPCGGDSGGPAVYEGQLVGIVTLGGRNCSQPNSIHAYTSVANYYNWILDNTGDEAKFIKKLSNEILYT